MTEMTYLEIANLNENSRVLVMDEISDQSILENFAKHDIELRVRLAALKKLTDQKVLLEIAKSSDYCYPDRKSAIQRLTDQNDLVCLTKANDSYIRQDAVLMLTYQKVLLEIAKSDDYYCYRLAVKKLTDQSLLIDCALNAIDCDVRDLARKGITDQNAFEEALMNAPPHVKRRYFLLYLKIRFFGTYSFRQAKRICKNREVTPRLLQQLNGSLSGWTFSGKECARLEALLSALKTKLEKTTEDISELESERDIVADSVIKSSYNPVIEALRNQESIFRKTLEETNSCLTEMKKQKEKTLSIFYEAEKAAEMYQKHSEVMSRVMEHQTDIKGLLEKAHTDI